MTEAIPRPPAPDRGSSPVDVVSMGCRLNAYEAEVIRAHARAAGLGDTIIVNTCAVTGEAVRQATQSIRRLKRERPGATVIVTGCAAQLDPLRFADMAEVDHVVGNAEKMQAHTFLALAKRPATVEGALPRVAVGDIMRVRETALHLVDGFTGRARATVEIQNGCDHRCTFCIIPFARGPSRSLAPDAIVSRVRDHVRAGYAEVVLTGVDITSYGGDLRRPIAGPTMEPRVEPDVDPGAATTLGQLVRRILDEVPELPRLRLSSIDQVEADEALVRAIAEHPRLMPHLHLSLQSGDDLILKRMKRRHLSDDAVRFCERIRRLRPDVVFGADLIAGFPTETEAQFRNSLDLIDACGITYVHAFPFSPRVGTPAARMPQVGRAVAKERAARLRAAGDRRLAAHLASLVRTRQSIVVEAGSMGRTPQYNEVRFGPDAFPSGPPAYGSVVELFITGVDGRSLNGVPV